MAARPLGKGEFIDTAREESRLQEVHAVDPALFERAKTMWQHGDWEALRALDSDGARQHPDRARLALLAAAGCQQLGDMEGTRRHVDEALSWGCDKRLVSQVLVAGVFNTLGRAAAAAGQADRACVQFEKAVRTADPHCNDKLLGHARAMHEMVRLGLLPQAVAHLDEGLRGPGSARRDAELGVAHRRMIDLEVDWLRDRVVQLQRRLDAAAHAVPMVGKVAPADSAATPPKPMKQYFGLNGLDRKLEAYIDFDGGYFVELGANDGVAQSNTLYFERERGWRGVLIEPIVHKFIECRKNRSPDNRYFCAACVSEAYDKPYVNLTYANLMTAPRGVESDVADPAAHAATGRVYLPAGEDTVDVMATARTLSSLLDEAAAPALVDLLSLDVEGGELEVLKGINHAHHRFRYMLIESRELERLSRYLTAFGYRLVDKISQHDYLFAAVPPAA